MNSAAKTLIGQLAGYLGDQVIRSLNQDKLAELATKIADRKERYENEKDPEERRQLEKDIRFLKASLTAKTEMIKLGISNKVEKTVRAGIESVLKTVFPFLA